MVPERGKGQTVKCHCEEKQSFDEAIQKEKVLKKNDVNTYGTKPFKIAVIHGGPGAAGYMKPVALELSNNFNILEPLQSKLTIQEQIDELKEQISKYTDEPITLIGSSWGAILSLFFASQNQNMLDKIILVGCGTFTKKATDKAEKIRMSRLTKPQQEKLKENFQLMNNLSSEEQKNAMREMAGLLSIADKYSPIVDNGELKNLDWNIFKNVWTEFIKMQENPEYLKSVFSKINIPVILIQGNYDAFLTTEIYEFLKECIPQIKLYELEKCGHYPWIEKYAKDEFYEIIKKVIL